MEAPNSTAVSYEYTTFPRQFLSYRWFKPFLVALLAFVFMFLFQLVLFVVATIWSGDIDFISTVGNGYDDMDAYTGPGALAELGTIAVILPALALAALIVRDRPYSSYSSSRGGWSWRAFFKCLAVAVTLLAVTTAVQLMLFPDENATGAIRFTVIGFILCATLVPLQCVAEEYVFRGFIVQTVGAWTKLPVVAIVLSAIVFALGHPYNLTGMITIFLNGAIWGALVWRTKGLEASSAYHIVNNMIAFGLDGFGITNSTSQIDVASLVVDVLTCLAFAAVIVFADKKRGWFAPRYDGTAKFNQKVRERAARKQKKANVQPDMPYPPSGEQQFTQPPAQIGQPYAPASQPYAPAGQQQISTQNAYQPAMPDGQQQFMQPPTQIGQPYAQPYAPASQPYAPAGQPYAPGPQPYPDNVQPGPQGAQPDAAHTETNG